jgi:hypothetical protein
MAYFRQRWYQVGLGIAIVLLLGLPFWRDHLSSFRTLLTISFMTLLVHQAEEYQFPGYFPRMINTVLFDSRRPDRYPLNANTAWIINVWLGWGLYILAIVFGEHAVWLAIATIVVSAGNVFAHGVLFNVRGRTFYNPGLLTALLLFLPLIVFFFVYTARHGLLDPANLIIGIIIGMAVNYVGIVRTITLLARSDTPYAFVPFR